MTKLPLIGPTDLIYMQGDQASIVGGAIHYVKELEHLLQTLEAQKLLLPEQGGIRPPSTSAVTEFLGAPFAQFFARPQFTWSQFPSKCLSKSAAAVADIEVTLIETHANLRILCRRNLRQVEEVCQLTSPDEIAGAVHHMLGIIEEEGTSSQC
ncbi:hypothetical protein RHMOL_Rhmol07G0152600 [Rhododendron molle]|uniref:Uncharacterized protein n=1 Tax=Rhododendron molle TaxID=49168 RepID=A0ACC0N134_RHOML|nr:hypothetical protein RHMOL_Rhmol07G0152600 [Rhododendron molle]